MSLHINPVQALQNGVGIVVAPEVMLLYPENSEVFKLIQKTIGDWEYYVSPAIDVDAVAYVSVQAGDITEEAESKCNAYIYGWMPKTVEWIEGSCVAILYFSVPKIVVTEPPATVTVVVRVESEGQIIFNSKRTIPVVYDVSDEDTDAEIQDTL